MKLYQALLEKLKPHAADPASQICNPARAKVGSSVNISFLDYRGKDFKVKDIQEFSMTVDGTAFQQADYVLLYQSPDGKSDKTVKLRLAPDGTGFRALVLEQLDGFEFNQEFKAIVEDPSLEFTVDGNEVYRRCGNVKIPYRASVKCLVDKPCSLDIWDYSRTAQVDGTAVEQFVYAEIDSDSGWSEIWKGEEVSSDSVEVF